jgi:hypothetical protein
MSTYQIGAYYFPNYHRDARNEAAHGEGWTEWELLRRAEPRFPGHLQPKTPQWGYEDEADPRVMARKVAAAADHGLNHFIFDWYWYDDGPFLSRALDEGFLGAANHDRLRFALMWANHDWLDIHPAKLGGNHARLHRGAVTRDTFATLTARVIEKYFRHPSYWEIDGCPYFSIYELMTLMRGLGGIEATRAALQEFRAQTRAAGFPDLHLNAVVWGVQILPNEKTITQPRQLLDALGFDSVASYVWIHHVPLPAFPATPYNFVAQEAARHWRQAATEYSIPYHPNVTMGWDASPRTVQSDRYQNAGYPFMPTLEENTPENFKRALQQARDFLDAQSGEHKILSINAWNEWTEGSYLEPDTVHGLEYLAAIREVFAADAKSPP